MAELKQGWLSPSGEFFECCSFEHIEIARKLIEPLNCPEYDFKTNRRISPDERLMKLGWVYIGVSSFMCHEYRIGWGENRLSPEQRHFLRPYFDGDGGLPVNEIAVMRWELDEI